MKKLFGIAIVSLVIFFIFTLFSPDVSINSHHAIHLSHALPDASLVILNSDSELSYNDDFTEERKLHLDGEAFFDVEKGNPFTVCTDEGKVAALGASFNVLARGGVFVVSCKSGIVTVMAKDDQSITISSGERSRSKNGNLKAVEKINPKKIDSWTTGESIFELVPLVEVIASLGYKYDIIIDLPEEYHDRLFSGSFLHSDLEEAVHNVLAPMKIGYDVDKNNKVLIY